MSKTEDADITGKEVKHRIWSCKERNNAIVFYDIFKQIFGGYNDGR